MTSAALSSVPTAISAAVSMMVSLSVMVSLSLAFSLFNSLSMVLSVVLSVFGSAAVLSLSICSSCVCAGTGAPFSSSCVGERSVSVSSCSSAGEGVVWTSSCSIVEESMASSSFCSSCVSSCCFGAAYAVMLRCSVGIWAHSSTDSRIARMRFVFFFGFCVIFLILHFCDICKFLGVGSPIRIWMAL